MGREGRESAREIDFPCWRFYLHWDPRSERDSRGLERICLILNKFKPIVRRLCAMAPACKQD